MAETLEDACDPIGGKKWNWYNVQKDLIEQGGLEDKELTIDPLSVNAHGCGGTYKGNPFYITWVPDTFLLVTAKEYSQKLIDAFSKVVEYEPFVKYKEPDDGTITIEWDKHDPQGRYQELLKEGKLELTKLL